ncbi:MAG: DoxX family protein [Verrucomicrobia bacterium]|nr:DoxX family protein [Verrucomicrobiota bacterium]MBV8376947.1 DoxX family protein [Verrucomicrobiota bacterium]
MFKSLAKHSNLGLLIGRIGIGAIFIVSGWHKLSGGQSAWTHYGHAMASLGINLFPNVWGLIAALSEFAGGILLVLGVLFRPAAILIFLTMLVACVSTFREHPHNFTQYSRPIEMLCIMFVFVFVGPGKYSFEGG